MKNVIKYILIAYILYASYMAPKSSWDKNLEVKNPNNEGGYDKLTKEQCTFTEYAIAWWKETIKNHDAKYILTTCYLTPLGIKL